MVMPKKYVNEVTSSNIDVMSAKVAWRATDEQVMNPDKEYIIKTTVQIFEYLEKSATILEPSEYKAQRNRIVDLNILLVSTVLKKYKPYSQDMFQEGCIGLIKAADSFTLSRGVAFGNYACACIENELRMKYGYLRRKIESQVFMEFLDAEISGADDEDMVKMELIEDAQAWNDFMEMFEEDYIQAIFAEVVYPSIKVIAKETKSALDSKLWAELELQYMVDLCMRGQKFTGLTFTSMAGQLGTVVQNIRSRHERTMRLCRELFIVLDF